jgi:hypothetical protein
MMRARSRLAARIRVAPPSWLGCSELDGGNGTCLGEACSDNRRVLNEAFSGGARRIAPRSGCTPKFSRRNAAGSVCPDLDDEPGQDGGVVGKPSSQDGGAGNETAPGESGSSPERRHRSISAASNISIAPSGGGKGRRGVGGTSLLDDDNGASLGENGVSAERPY